MKDILRQVTWVISKNQVFLAVLGSFAVGLLALGCSEGPLWRTGYMSPWAQQKWAEDEQIAETLFSKRDNLRALVAQAQAGNQSDQNAAVDTLTGIIENNPILLMRIEAAELLGNLQSDSADAALLLAVSDPESDVRLAAVRSCTRRGSTEALLALQKAIGSDTDLDVRLAATRAVSGFSGPQAVQALGLALEDTNPAIQVRAADSLQLVTGESLGRDIPAWQTYIAETFPQSPTSEPVNTGLGSTTKTADADSNDNSFKLR